MPAQDCVAFASAVASSSPPPALLPRRLAAMTRDEITRWLAVPGIAAAQHYFFNRSLLKVLCACPGLARSGLRLNLLGLWRIRRVKARLIIPLRARQQQRAYLTQLLRLWSSIAWLQAFQRPVFAP